MKKGSMDYISYSVCIDRKPEFRTNPLNQILPRRIYSWIDDNTVTNCYNCKMQFSVFKLIRKHHCRLCGRIFCYNCCNQFSTIPENLLSEDSKKGTINDYISYYTSYTSKGPTKYRICNNCNDILINIQQAKNLIEVFKILKLDIIDLLKISRVCKIWQYATNFILSIFREIQYKLPTDKFSDHEIDLLWTNIDHFIGHSKYVVQLLKVCKSSDDFAKAMHIIELNERKNDCWSMMCSRNCKPKLTSMDAINLLVHSFKNENVLLRSIAISNITCDDAELKCYIPLLVYYLREDNGKLMKFLVNRCAQSFLMFSCLYWEIQIYTKEPDPSSVDNIYKYATELLMNEYFDKNEDKHEKITQQIMFIDVLKNLSKYICEGGNQDSATKLSCLQILNTPSNNLNSRSPLNPDVCIRNINMEKIKIKDSATKPILIPCIKTDNSIYNILYKHDDLRKDQIVQNIIRLIDIIVKQEEHIDLNIITYDVLPIDKNNGILKIVDNSDTIYFIEKKMNCSILNYILENNSEIKIKGIRERFIRSTAAYCVITYLLGIGDRHLDNIMITGDGKLFHIDYGYLLGKEPTYGSAGGIRLTPEIIEAIGGANSSNYTQFTELCTRIYNCLRRNVDIIMNMIMILPKLTHINITEAEIIDQVIKRFIPGENYVNANLHFENQLENQSYTHNIKDWFHYINKERISTLRFGIF